MNLFSHISKSLKICCTAIILASTQSCSLDIPLENSQTDPNVVYNLLTAQELLASAYQEIPKSQFEFELLSDNFIPSYTAVNSPATYQLYSWQSSAISDFSNSEWSAYYTSISYINTAIERIEVLLDDSNQSFELRKVLAEAYTLKAYAYFQLLQLFATPYTHQRTDGIILKDKVEAEVKERSSKQDCVTRIIELLHQALELDESFPSKENRKYSKIYTSSVFVQGLLAKVHLYTGKYDLAEKYAKLCNEIYYQKPVTAAELNILWSTTESNLSIFMLANNNPFYKDLLDVANQDINNYYVADKLEMDNTDIRKKYSTTNKTISSGSIGETIDVLELLKYNKINRDNITPPYIVIMRNPEPLFLLCEALCLQNKVQESASILNEYLTSVKAKPYEVENMTKDQLIAIILLEKSKEFVGEGIRFYDLKKYELNNRNKISAADYRWTFPIPSSEYKPNTTIVNQNDGWPAIIH